MALIAKLDPGQRPRRQLAVGNHRYRLQRSQGQGSARRRCASGQLGPGVQAGEHLQAQGLRRCRARYAVGEMLPIALNYLGEDPNSFDAGRDPQGRGAADDHSSLHHRVQFLASTSMHWPMATSAWRSAGRATSSRQRPAPKRPRTASMIKYNIPKEGAPMWFDMMAIPKDAKHPNNAHLFINYIMRPEVMAGNQQLRHLRQRQQGFDGADGQGNPGKSGHLSDARGEDEAVHLRRAAA